MSEWISVKDELPDVECHYLVFTEDGFYELMFFENDEWQNDAPIYGAPSHWMPLPNPPKDEA